MNKLKLFPVAWLLILGVAACEDSEGGGGNSTDPCVGTENQPQLFENVADHLIIPGYETLQEDVDLLQTRTQTFVDNPDMQKLEELRRQWRLAYLSFQEVAQYNFGPAEEVFLRSSLNNFPANEQEIETKVQEGQFSFDDPSAFDKGFPAIDFLLYEGQDDQAVVDRFVSGDKAGNYRQYLMGVVEDIQSRVDQTLNAWKDGYREAFIQNTGNAAGTSLSLLINNLNENYEIVKRDKVGIPSGIVTLGFTNPDKVEAFHSGLSKELILAAVRASDRLFRGESRQGIDGFGLDELLQQANAQKDGEPLSRLIKDQYQQAITATEALPAPLSAAVDDNPEVVETAYKELVRQVVQIKTDMPSVLCVAITYVDNPSDSD